jgi:hypothetical protein
MSGSLPIGPLVGIDSEPGITDRPAFLKIVRVHGGFLLPTRWAARGVAAPHVGRQILRVQGGFCEATVQGPPGTGKTFTGTGAQR